MKKTPCVNTIGEYMQKPTSSKNFPCNFSGRFSFSRSTLFLQHIEDKSISKQKRSCSPKILRMCSTIFFLHIIFFNVYSHNHRIFSFLLNEAQKNVFFIPCCFTERTEKISFTNRKTFLSFLVLQSSLRKTMEALTELYSAPTIRTMTMMFSVICFFESY